MAQMCKEGREALLQKAGELGRGKTGRGRPHAVLLYCEATGQRDKYVEVPSD